MCKALEELRMEGVLQGRTEGIRATVKTCKKFQINKEAIIETIGKEFSMPEKEVAEYVEKYWYRRKRLPELLHPPVVFPECDRFLQICLILK